MKCTFCSITIRPGAGKLFVRKDGSILTFCSRKCEKNLLQLKRKSHTTKWTQKFHDEKKAGKK